MMPESFDDLLNTFEAVAEEAQTMTFSARAIELQEGAVQVLEAFLTRLATEKQTRISALDEEPANILLAMELALETVLNELKMWIDLKQERPESAWDHLVTAQQLCLSAVSVRRQLATTQSTVGLENLYGKLQALERLLFPPQLFTSIGGTAKMRECSICGADYDDCDHVKGHAYLGQLCHTVIREMRLEEVSVVEDPANKRCRITHFSDEGKMRNKMTWRLETR
jgi:hypothetical protein